MRLVVIVVLAILVEGFMSYVLVRWWQESRPRKKRDEVHRKKPFLVSARQARAKEQFRDFEEAIHRRIARYTVFGNREFGKK